MTLLEIINEIQEIAAKQQNINAIVKTGDIYDLNKEEYQQQYSAFCLTQRTHSFRGNTVTFNFVMYYVDRLTLDEKNKNEVQSTGCNVLMKIVHDIEELDGVNVDYGDIVTFTSRFSALCAGAYLNIGVTVNVDQCYLDI